MKISFINHKERTIFGVPVRYFQIGDEVVTFGDEISEGDSVKLSGSRLVKDHSLDDEDWVINLIGDSIFLSSGGEILLKGESYNNKKGALVKMPIDGWALTYCAHYNEFTLFRFTSNGVEWIEGIDADVAMSFYGLEFPIEVKFEEGDE